jgi:SAM-dependent methyltransferase
MTNLANKSIDWKEESRRFDGVAELYDARRPGYPEELLDALFTMTGLQSDSKILEIGSGTGKATLMLARRGLSVLCIEPGPNLVALAAQNLKDFPQVAFETITFEQWCIHPCEYDLVLSAQAFHWISREIRYTKAAQTLKDGGHLALIWNMYPDLTADIFLELNKVYQARAPELANRSNSCEELIQQREREIGESGLFYNIRTIRFPWSVKYSVQDYLGLLSTYSDHLRLSDEKRERLFQGIAEVIHKHGGYLERPYLAVLYVAQKAA